MPRLEKSVTEWAQSSSPPFEYSDTCPPSPHTEPSSPREEGIELDDYFAIDDFIGSVSSPRIYNRPYLSTDSVCSEPTSLRKTTGTLFTTFHRRTRSLDWNSLQDTVARLADSASDAISARVNKAFEGKDAVAMFDMARSLVPSVSIPSTHQMSQTFDRISDAVQDLLEKTAIRDRCCDADFEGSQWQFARIIGTKARMALVQQGICPPYCIMPSHKNIEWQCRLNQYLAETFRQQKLVNGAQSLFAMKPVWVADREKKMWRLVLDTGNKELIITEDGDLDDVPETVETGFEVEGQEDWMEIDEWARGCRTVEDGEWEEVEL